MHDSNPSFKKGLSQIDKNLLEILLSSDRVSSSVLSKKLGIPISTVQRRRKRLEEEYLRITKSLVISKFGLRHIRLLISTAGALTEKIAETLQVAYIAITSSILASLKLKAREKERAA